MMASSTADPKAPPMARAEKASPVAVDRNACGALNCTQATSSVSGPDWPMPAMMLNPICAWFQWGWKAA
jgi:hypothetical protein